MPAPHTPAFRRKWFATGGALTFALFYFLIDGRYRFYRFRQLRYEEAGREVFAARYPELAGINLDPRLKRLPKETPES